MSSAQRPDEEIKELYAYGAGLQSLSDVAGLNRFVKLEFLSLHGNRIEQIQGLEGLLLLRELNLSSNNIKKMEGLANLARLQVLNLSCNHIEEIQDVQGLLALRKLLLSHNRISKLGGLSALHGPRYALQLLDFRDNVISSLAELDVLAGCVNLTELIFSWGNHSNPCCLAPAYKSAVVAAIPHILKLDGNTVCPGAAGFSCLSQGPSHMGGNVQSGRAGYMLPSWALHYKDGCVQNIPFVPDQTQPRQVFLQPQPEIPISSEQERCRNCQLDFQSVSGKGGVCQVPLASEWETISRPEMSSWVNQPSSSNLLSMGSRHHPGNNKTLTSSDLQSLGPSKGTTPGDSGIKSGAGITLRKISPKTLDNGSNPRKEIVERGVDVSKADHSSQTNHDAWLEDLEERILDMIQQLPIVKADPQGEPIGQYDDAVLSRDSSKAQRLDSRDVLRQKRKQNGKDSELNAANAANSSVDTSDNYPSGLRPLLHNGDSGSESPECQSPARRWVHFGDKWTRQQDPRRPGRVSGKETGVTRDNDALEQLYEEVKVLQAGFASLMTTCKGVPEKKLKEQSETTIELKQDEKETALCKLRREHALLERKMTNSEEKFSEERSAILRRLEEEHEERKRLQEVHKSEQEEIDKLQGNLKAAIEERNKVQESLKAEQENSTELHRSLEAKQSAIRQLERTLQERDVKGQEMRKTIENLGSERSQTESLLQEKYRGKFLSLTTELISLTEALKVATLARQKAESALLDATAENESSRQLAILVGKQLEEEKAKLGFSNSELEACRSLVLELREQVDKSSKDISNANLKQKEALEQLTKFHKQEMQEVVARESTAGEKRGMLAAERKVDQFRNAMDLKLRDAQKDLQQAREEIVKIRQDMDNLQNEKGREEATLKETIRRILLKEQDKDALVVELSSVVRLQKMKLQTAQFDLERLAEVEEDLHKMHQEMIGLRRKADKYSEVVFEVESLRQKLAGTTGDTEKQKESIEEKSAQIVSLQNEIKILTADLQRLQASDDAVKVKNKMLDSQNETIKELKLELSQAKEAFRQAVKTSDVLETEWTSRLQIEINQVFSASNAPFTISDFRENNSLGRQEEALQSKLSKQGLTLIALEEKLKFERAAKMAADKSLKGLQEKLEEKEGMFRYVEEEIRQVKELYDSKLKEVGVERDQAFEELKTLHQEKEQLEDVLAAAQRRREELQEAAKALEASQKAEAIEKNLQLARALQRVAELESELKSQGHAVESQKLVLVSKLDQLHKLLEELREGK